jgi:hypothetical protein
MSAQQSPLTYEGILEMFRENAVQAKESERKLERMFQESDRKFQETVRQMKENDRKVNKKISALGSRIGAIIESMVKGNIVAKFQALKYDVTQYGRNVFFENKKLGLRGEIDLFLEDGDTAILIEVKTTLETADVRKHIERLEKYRHYTDAKGSGDKRRFIGAVAGAVVTDEAEQFAQENGMYVIVQSGKAVEILPSPEGFKAKEW